MSIMDILVLAAVMGASFLITAIILLANKKVAEPKWWKCAWCGIWFSDLGSTSWKEPACHRDEVSHGLCFDCFAKKKRDEGLA